MSATTQGIERKGRGISSQTWGIEPVPQAQRRLGFPDYFVLWLDLGVGLLVIAAGALVAPLGFGWALLAILVGSVLGSLMLALTGIIGSRTGVPTMPLLRPVLGLRGSYLPSVLNVLQLVGWTAFELWAMGFAADTLSQQILGFSNTFLWTVIFGAFCILLTLGGPLVVVRQWLKKFGVWVVLASSAWITFNLLTRYDIGALLSKPGAGGLSFLVAVDLVIALPISWMPLVADYNRFARDQNSSFWGTLLGYTLANVWFYAVGLLLVLTSVLKPDFPGPVDVAVAISGLTAGLIALTVILVDETDNAFADLYSAAVSAQNILPRLNQRLLIIGFGAVSILLAFLLDMTQFEGFLLLMGALFVPLFGLLTADYFVVRRRYYEVAQLYREGGKYWFAAGLNWPAIAAWLAGIVVYNITNPFLLAPYLGGWGSGFPDWLVSLGGSIPSFVVSFALYWLFASLMRTRYGADQPAAER